MIDADRIRTILLFLIGHVTGTLTDHRQKGNALEIERDELRLTNLIKAYEAADGDMRIIKRYGLDE